jgi:small-conductance mechanosensitive channel
VQFVNFGDSSLDFKVLFWARNSWEVEFVKSDIRFAIDQRFREAKVTIPFPQRDVHFFDSRK